VDFTFDEVQEDLRGLARTILDEQATPARAKELEAGTDRVDRDLWATFASADLLGVALPEPWGGGYGLLEACVLLEEVGRRVAPIPLLATVVLGAMPVAALGSDEQRARLLPGVVDGSTLLTAALHGSATAEGDRLTGTFDAVPWGGLADEVVVAVGDDLWLVAGGERLPAEATNLEPQCRLVLDGTPAERLAPGGRAWLERRALAGICATSVGVLDEAVRITAAYVSEREQFGRPIGAFQGVAMRAADAFVDASAAWVTTWSAIWRLSEGRPADEQLAIAKFWCADGGHRVVHAAQHLHGGMGVDTDYPIHRYTQWAKALEHQLGGATASLLRLGDLLCTSS
jgi:alkylation response protein AidB-like acyl-CoA dehydrogenase